MGVKNPREKLSLAETYLRVFDQLMRKCGRVFV